MIDRVFSMIIVIVIVLLVGTFLYVSVFQGYAAEQTLARQTYEQEYGELLIDSMLLSHEEDSGLTYESLLAISLREVSTVIDIDGNPVDVEAEFTEVLDGLLGSGNYYFVVKPQVEGVSISYILDGSPTMADKRAEVNARLPELMADLRELFGPEAAIRTHIYILTSSTNETFCPSFMLGADMTCDDVSGDELYAELSARGFSPPAPAPFRSYEQWLSSTHLAKTAHMSESDWASAAAYASYMYQDDPEERAMTGKHVIVTVADELSSNSKADYCHTLNGEQLDLFFCFLCNNTCPYARSSAVVTQAGEVLAENEDLFLGFYSMPCSYEYDPYYSSAKVSNYSCQFIDGNRCKDGVDRPADVNWCEQNACGACTRPAAWEGKYCLHSACDGAVIQNLTYLSSITGGTTQDLSSLEQLTGAVYEYFSAQQASFNFSIGVEERTRDRFVIERPFTLASGKTMTLSFWIYD